ncbi:hypothetical protein M4951_05430 [Blastopirellula sp. J2-11]|uniref:hypothetical protein n=1 Tax=Blastopirellula sp. J2-11 TaxID=2943192 RepID=UPI0021C82109|nr:hypothetical protein [Blastopirellula sp. J2-11]UUO07751.1 hypothetical protein M4951_05430 [Blastopirellula sp. J2-11]
MIQAVFYSQFAIATTILLAVGCAEKASVNQFDVSGVVTFDGKPVPHGSIIFQPDEAQGNAGPYGSAMIKDGKFDTRVDNGTATIGGPHLISIEAFDGVEPNQDYAPYGRSIGDSYQEAFVLPQTDSTLNIELKDRKPSR